MTENDTAILQFVDRVSNMKDSNIVFIGDFSWPNINWNTRRYTEGHTKKCAQCGHCAHDCVTPTDE